MVDAKPFSEDGIGAPRGSLLRFLSRRAFGMSEGPKTPQGPFPAPVGGLLDGSCISHPRAALYPCLPIPSEGQWPLSSKNWTRRASERLDKLAAPRLGDIPEPNKVSSATVHIHRNEVD